MLMAKTSYKVQAVALLKVMLGIALFMTRFKTRFPESASCRACQGSTMNDYKPDGEHEAKPSTNRLERPDNGSKSSRGFGPSSGAHKDNPHKRQKLTRHAWLKR